MEFRSPKGRAMIGFICAALSSPSRQSLRLMGATGRGKPHLYKLCGKWWEIQPGGTTTAVETAAPALSHIHTRQDEKKPDDRAIKFYRRIQDGI